MKGRPFNITSSRHMLSAYAERKGLVGEAYELRTLVGNMKAQTLLHNYDVSDVQKDDLAEYVASVGGSMTDPSVTRVLNTLQGSTDLTARFIPASVGGSWELNLRDWTRGTPNVGAFISHLFDELKTPSKTFRTVQNNYQATRPQCLVFAWDTAVFSPVINAVSDSVLTMTDYVRGKLKDPHAWFESKLATYGFDLSYLVRGPLVLTSVDVSSSSNFCRNVGNAYKRQGCVTIIGPTDLFQKSQLYYYPAWAADTGFIGVGVWAGNSTAVTGGTYHVPKIDGTLVDVTAAVNGAGVTEVGATRYQALMGVPGAFMWYDGSLATPWRAYTASSGSEWVCMQLPLEDFGVSDSNIATLRTSLSPLFDGSLQGTLGSTSVNMVQRSSQWKVAFPTYVAQLLFQGPMLNAVIDSAGIKRYELRCDVIGMTSTFQSLRDFAAQMRDHPNATVTDKANFQKFVDQTEELADDMVYTSMYSAGRAAPSKAYVANLAMVKKIVDAGVDIWSEKIGKDATFDDLAKKLQKDFESGLVYYIFSTVRSDVAGMDTLVSTRVQNTLGSAASWVVTGSLDPISGSPSFTGSYMGGAQEVLSSTEAAIIVAGGGVQGVGATDDMFTAAGFGSNWRTQLSDLAKTEVFSSSSGVSYSRPNTRAPMELSTSAFCNAYGMPVMNYTDLDSYVRGCLLFKGVKGDPAGLVAQSFFVNTLDI